MNIIKNIYIHLQLSPQTRSLEIKSFHQRVCWLFSFLVSAPNVPFLRGFGSLGLTCNVSPPFAGWPPVRFASRGRCRRAGYLKRGEGTWSPGQAHCPCQQGSLSQQRRLAPVPTAVPQSTKGPTRRPQIPSPADQRPSSAAWVLIVWAPIQAADSNAASSLGSPAPGADNGCFLHL